MRRRTGWALGAVAVCTVGALVAWWAMKPEPGPEPGPDSRPVYLALSSDTLDPGDPGVDDKFRVIFDDGTTESGDSFDSMRYPLVVRYGDGFATASKDGLSVIDRGGREVQKIPTEGSGSVEVAASSASSTAVSFAYRVQKEDGFHERVMTVVDDEIHYADGGPVGPVGLTVCDDGTTYWLDSVSQLRR